MGSSTRTASVLGANGPRVVIIDDEPSIVDFVQLGLRYDGFEVEAAADGREGLDMVQRMRSDLVILDIMLPSIDGLDVLRRLRSDLNDIRLIRTFHGGTYTFEEFASVETTLRPSSIPWCWPTRVLLYHCFCYLLLPVARLSRY